MQLKVIYMPNQAQEEQRLELHRKIEARLVTLGVSKSDAGALASLSGIYSSDAAVMASKVINRFGLESASRILTDVLEAEASMGAKLSKIKILGLRKLNLNNVDSETFERIVGGALLLISLRIRRKSARFIREVNNATVSTELEQPI